MACSSTTLKTAKMNKAELIERLLQAPGEEVHIYVDGSPYGFVLDVSDVGEIRMIPAYKGETFYLYATKLNPPLDGEEAT